jgi:NADH-quinone oxidoreductase subunit J
MTIANFIFYLVSSMILVFGVLTISTRQLFRSAIYLLFSLINVAALFFLMDNEFLAAVQVVVYVGGIIVLILFSLFLTQQAGLKLPLPGLGRSMMAGLLSFFGFVLLFSLLLAASPEADENSFSAITMKEIGFGLLNFGKNGYVLPFEVVSILLLAAMIGAIAIAFKTKKE